MSDTMSPPKMVSSSHDAEPDERGVAARRMTTDRSSPNASQNATYRNVTRARATRREDLGRPATIPSRMMPERRDDASTTDEHERDDRQPGGELAVDHVVAVDRLRQEPRQRALGPLAVDRVEGEGEPEQRRDEAEELRRPTAA